MKKLFIIVSLVFSIFLVSDEVFALEYEVNDNTYTVDSVESLRDYIYYHYNPNKYFCFIYSNQYRCYIDYTLSNPKFYVNSYGGGYQFNTSSSSCKTLLVNSSDFSLISENLNYSMTSSNANPNNSFLFSNLNIYNNSDNSLYQSANFTFQQIEDKYNTVSEPTYYTITYYLNNEIYREIEVEEGTSHTLLYYEPNSDYNFSGWDYGNANLSNIQSDITITGTTTLKPYYTISYYLNSELYNSVSVIEGTNYSLVDYVPPKNYQFSGWTYDSNIDLSNIQSNVNIFGTSVYVRPQMTYNEESNSIIHDLSYSILGDDVPVEFDYVYTLVDYLILLILVFCAIVPFLIVFKLLGGW